MIENSNVPQIQTKAVIQNVDAPKQSPIKAGKDTGSRISDSDFFKLLITFILLVFLFGIAFLISLNDTKRKRDQENAKIVPIAEIKLPNSTSQDLSPEPTVKETAGWNVYLNTKWSFSFSFPENIFTTCNSSQDVDIVGLWKLPFPCPEAHDTVYSIGARAYEKGSATETKPPSSVEESTIGSYKVVKKKYDYTDENGPLFDLKESTEVVFSNEASDVVFQVFGNSKDDLDLFDKIISSFKFIE